MVVASVVAVSVATPAPAIERGETELVSVGSGGAAAQVNAVQRLALSGNGRFVLYRDSGEGLIWQDLVGSPSSAVLVNRNLDNNVVSGAQPAISSDGCMVAFVSTDSRLVAGDTNGRQDVFVRRMCPTMGPIERVSLGPGGVQVTDASSGGPVLSGDGSTLAFLSTSTQIVPGMEDSSARFSTEDVFVRDLATGVTELVTKLPPATVTGSTHLTGSHFFSVRLTSQALTERGDVLVFGGSYGTGALASEPCSGTYERWTAYAYRVRSGDAVTPIWPHTVGCRADPVISADGSTVVVRTRVPGGYEAASPSGARAMTIAVPGHPTDLPVPSIGRRGGRLAFTSTSAAIVDDDTNGVRDAFVLDWPGSVATRVSVSSAGVQANGTTSQLDLSHGFRAVFVSTATNLDPADILTDPDLFLRGLPGRLGRGLSDPACCSGHDSSRPWAGDPVDAASGNFIDTTVDLTGPSGTSLGLARTYNSFDARQGLFGVGWSSIFDVEVSDAGEWADVTLDDGRIATFEADGSGGWTRPPRLRADLVEDGGLFSMTWDDGRVWGFDADDRLVSVTTPAGEVVQIDRDADGSPVAASSEVGGVERYRLELSYATTAYDWQIGPLVESVSGSDGRTVDVVFGPSGGEVGEALLARVGNPRPSGAAAWSSGWWQHSYDDADRLSVMERTVDASLNPTSTSVRTRLKVRNSYDEAGRVDEQVAPDGSTTTFVYGEGTTTVIDSASGDETTYLSDDDGRQVGVTDAEQAGLVQAWNGAGYLAEVTDRSGATTRMLYDAQQRLRVRLLPDPGTGEADEPGVGEDWTNVVTWATRYETWDYAATGGGPADPRVTAHRNVAGEVTTYTYAGAALEPATVTTAAGTDLEATTSYTYGAGVASGQLASVTTPTGVETLYSYDGDGRLAEVSAGGRVTGYTYLTTDDVEWDEDWSTAEPTAVEATQVMAAGSGSTASRTTTTLVDAGGRTVRVIDPLAGVDAPGHGSARTVYDDLGEPVLSVDEAGAETTTEVRYATDRMVPRDLEEPCGCDPVLGWAEPSEVGSVVTTTDPDGVVSEARYSHNGDLIEERVTDGSAVPQVTRHTYGPLGRLVQTEVDAGTPADPTTVVTTYGYDANGNPTQTTHGPTLGAVDRTTTLTYDRLGRVVEELGPEGDAERHHVVFTYDDMGRKVTETTAASDVTAAAMSTWRYDEAGRVAETVTFLDGYTDDTTP